MLPEGGNVEVLNFTDKQYERMQRFPGRRREPCRENPTQFDLF